MCLTYCGDIPDKPRTLASERLAPRRETGYGRGLSRRPCTLVDCRRGTGREYCLALEADRRLARSSRAKRSRGSRPRHLTGHRHAPASPTVAAKDMTEPCPPPPSTPPTPHHPAIPLRRSPPSVLQWMQEVTAARPHACPRYGTSHLVPLFCTRCWTPGKPRAWWRSIWTRHGPSGACQVPSVDNARVLPRPHGERGVCRV